MIIQGTAVRLSAVVTKDGSACDLTSATVLMKVAKPDSTILSLSAVIDTPVSGVVHADLLPASNDQSGVWKAWASATLLGGAVLVTSAEEFVIRPPGTPE